MKIEPKPEPKIEPKPKPEPKMEPKVESKPGPKVESKPAPKIEPKIEPKPKPEPEAKEKALTGIANDVNLLFDKYRDRLTNFIAKLVKRDYAVFAPDLFGMHLPGELDALLKKYGATVETLE